MEILANIRQSQMSWFQRRTVAIALVLILIDGFDVAVMAFAAPALSTAWSINPVALGYLLSAGLFGMAAGSIFLTPVADRIGRRSLALLAMGIISVGMIASVMSTDVAQLIACRVITGIGVGGMTATLNVLVAEYSSNKRRATMMGIYAAGFPIGATLCGLVGAPLIPRFGWQSIFITGAAATVILLALSFRYLPESLDFLLNKRPAKTLEKTNAILVKMGQPTINSLPQLPPQQTRQGMTKEIFTGAGGFRTIMLWTGYGLLTAGYYFANTWTPKIMAAASGDNALGVTIGTVANFGGIIGCIAFGLAAIFVRNRTLLTISLLAAAASFVFFAQVMHLTGPAIAVALLLGLLTTAGIAGFYALSPELYSAQNRVTGTGWMIGSGRLVSIVSPIVVGYLISGGWAATSIFPLFAGVLVLSALAVVALGISQRRTEVPASSGSGDTPKAVSHS